MMNQGYEWMGDERCKILQSIKAEIAGFSSLSPEEKAMLEWAVNELLRQYGCLYQDSY